MSNQEDFDAYYRGEMDADQLKKFERALNEDSDLREEYDLFLDGVASVEDLAIRDEIFNVISVGRSKDSWGLPTVLKIAASIILVGSVVLVLNFRNDDAIDPATLFKPYPDVISLRNNDSSFDAGLNHYNFGEYEKALNAFSTLPSSDTLGLYLSQCFLATGQYDSAIRYLSEIKDGSIFEEQRNWYLGLAYLLSDKKDSAEVSFDKIKEGDFNYDASIDFKSK